MKRFTLLFFVLVICFAAAIWYFGHHRNTTAEPLKIYKATPLPQRNTQAETPTPASTGHEHTKAPEASIVPSTLPDINKFSSESTGTLSEGTHAQSSHLEEDPKSLGGPDTSHDHDEDAGETSQEHLSALKAEYEAIRREGDEMAKVGNRILVNQLNQMSLEEQVVTLKKMKASVLHALHPLTQEPLYQTPSEAEDAWQVVLRGIVDTGYTLPPGVDD